MRDRRGRGERPEGGASWGRGSGEVRERFFRGGGNPNRGRDLALQPGSHAATTRGRVMGREECFAGVATGTGRALGARTQDFSAARGRSGGSGGCGAEGLGGCGDRSGGASRLAALAATGGGRGFGGCRTGGWHLGLRELVGTVRFELTTPSTPCWCATRLRYAPTLAKAAELYPNRKRRGIGGADQRRRMCRTSSSSRRTCLTIWPDMLVSIRPCSPSRRWRAPPMVNPCS